ILDDLAFRIIEPSLGVGQRINKCRIGKLLADPQRCAAAFLSHAIRKRHSPALDKLHVRPLPTCQNDWPRNVLLRLSWLPASRSDRAISLIAIGAFLPILLGRQPD